MNAIKKIEGKKYALNNSYFKNRKHDYPDTILDIVKYKQQFEELPFDCTAYNWLYEAMIERQKRHGIQNNQYLTPEKTAAQIAELTNNFLPKDNLVLDACCGTGQLTKYLLLNKLNVIGFDNDPDMVEICKISYPQARFELFDFRKQDCQQEYDLIVSNPPHEQKEMIPFWHWLSSALSDTGKAVLLIPKGYMNKERPRALVEYLKRFDFLHREDVREPFYHTKWICEVCVVGLKEFYKEERRNQQPKNAQNQNQIKLEPNLRENRLMEAEKVFLVGIDRISANPENSRKKFNQNELNELAHSIKEHGLLHPITLRAKGDGYEIVYGERRYRAFKLNGETQIPAIIREYTDEQILEITLVENINRENLTAIEESDAYQKLMDVRGYSIEDICHKSGKNESYIRKRLRLQRLIDEFKVLLEKDDLMLGIGIETAKYSKTIQKQIYKEYFTSEENNWKELGLKEYTERIEKLYTNDLSKFNFDKGECAKCQSNTALYELFSDKSGRCTNDACLQEKKSKFTINFCKVVSEQYPEISVCIAPYDKMNDTVNNDMKEIGVDIRTMKSEEYPEKPQAPVQGNYKTEQEYKEALDEFTIEEMSFYKEMEELEEKEKSGKIKKVIYVGDNNPGIRYVEVVKGKDLNPLENLQKQDQENKTAATRNAAKEVSSLLQSSEINSNQLSVFEDELLIFIMLDYLDKKYFPAFGYTDEKKDMLTAEEKYKTIKSLTPEQKALVYRNFLIKNLINHTGHNLRMMLLIEFSKQHFKEQTMDIMRKHTDIYNVKYQKIQNQIETLKSKKTPQTV